MIDVARMSESKLSGLCVLCTPPFCGGEGFTEVDQAHSNSENSENPVNPDSDNGRNT